jgi:hypothetical protein
MPNGLKKHQKEILIALERLGGTATVRQISTKIDGNVNGTSQSLGAPSMREYVKDTGQGRAGDRVWELIKKLPDSPRLFSVR